AHKQSIESPVPVDVRNFVRFYPAYIFQIKEFYGELYLCIDYTLQVKSVCRLNELLKFFDIDELTGRSAIGTWKGWRECRINKIRGQSARLYFFDYNQE